MYNKRKSKYIVLCMLPLAFILIIGCSQPTFTLTPTVNCAQDDIQIDIKAMVVAAESVTRPELVIEICVKCKGTPVTGASVQAGVVRTDNFTPPDILRGVFDFEPTNTAGTGCTTRPFRLSGLPAIFPPANLVGKEVEVKVLDNTGTIAKTEKVQIQ